jgi:hypothetical protein
VVPLHAPTTPWLTLPTGGKRRRSFDERQGRPASDKPVSSALAAALATAGGDAGGVLGVDGTAPLAQADGTMLAPLVVPPVGAVPTDAVAATAFWEQIEADEQARLASTTAGAGPEPSPLTPLPAGAAAKAQMSRLGQAPILTAEVAVAFDDASRAVDEHFFRSLGLEHVVPASPSGSSSSSNGGVGTVAPGPAPLVHSAASAGVTTPTGRPTTPRSVLGRSSTADVHVRAPPLTPTGLRPPAPGVAVLPPLAALGGTGPAPGSPLAALVAMAAATAAADAARSRD